MKRLVLMCASLAFVCCVDDSRARGGIVYHEINELLEDPGPGFARFEFSLFDQIFVNFEHTDERWGTQGFGTAFINLTNGGSADFGAVLTSSGQPNSVQFGISLDEGDDIVSNLSTNARFSAAMLAVSDAPPIGAFSTAGEHFIGFQFDGGSGDQLGWVRFNMLGPSRLHAFEVVDLAYASPGTSLVAGQTAVPEPTSTLSLLGFLGTLIAVRRTRRN